MTVLSLINASASPEVQMNEAIQAIDPLVVFSYDLSNSGGLNVSIRGGMWDGIDLASQIVALTANTTNYIVANRATGTASVSTTTTNWNDYPNYVRLHLAVAGATTLTSIKDWRVSANGVFAINQIEIEDQIVNGVVDKAPSQNAVFDALALKVNLAGDQTLTGIKTFEHVIVGNAGTESTGIDVNGTEYQSTFKVTDINGTHLAQTIHHKHSTSIAPLQLFARSNSNDNTHGNVTNSMPLAQRFAAGFAGSNYKLFGYDEFLVNSTGTVSNTSAPAAYKLWLTPDGSLTPVNVLSATATALSTGVNFNGATPTEIGYLSGVTSAIQTQLNARVLTSSVGAANGVCPLDVNTKVSTSYLPDSILGALKWQGTWNASTNSPTIPTAASGNKGHYYVVSVSGSTSIDGINDWVIGDWIVSSGTAWEKIDNSDKVSSIFGRVGPVTAQSGDYTAAQVGALSNATNSTQSGYFGNIYLQDDSTPSHYLEITAGSNLTAARTLTLLTGDSNRSLTLAGDATISGTNTGDQSSIVGITGTMAQFDTACTDGNFVFAPTWNSGRIMFHGASGVSDTSTLFYNSATGQLGVGTGTTTDRLTIGATSDASNTVRVNASGSGLATVTTICNTYAAITMGVNNQGSTSSHGFPNGTAGIGTANAVNLVLTTSGLERMRIQSGGNVGIGTASPSGILHAAGTSAMYYDRFGATAANLLIRSARGTSTTPTAILNGEIVSNITIGGHNGTAFADVAYIRCVASENHVVGSAGAYLSFATTLNGAASPSERVRINNDGNVMIYGSMTFPKTQGAWVKVDTANPRSPWRDITCDLAVRTSGTTAPTNAAFRGGRCQALFFDLNDEIEISVHIPHDYVMGTNIYLHPHWGHNGTAISGSLVIDYYHTYSKGHNGDIFPAEKQLTQTLSGLNLTNTPRYSHRVDDIQISTSGGSATLIDSSLLEPDGIIRITAVVSTIPTITGGSRNEPYIMNVDMHYMSTELGTVERTPNFWV